MSLTRGAAGLLGLLAAAACAGRESAPDAAPDVGGPGAYVVVSDSSRVSFVLAAVPEPLTGSFPGVRGALTLEADSRGFLRGSGRLSIDLTAPALADTALREAFTDDLLEVGRSREFRTAELVVRDVVGHQFRAGLPGGVVRPLRVLGRLNVHGMALTRSFDAQAAPTPSGYRITTTVPVLLTAEELRVTDRLEPFADRAGLEAVSGPAVVTVDLWLSRRAESAGTAGGG